VEAKRARTGRRRPWFGVLAVVVALGAMAVGPAVADVNVTLERVASGLPAPMMMVSEVGGMARAACRDRARGHRPELWREGFLTAENAENAEGR